MFNTVYAMTTASQWALWKPPATNHGGCLLLAHDVSGV